MKKPVFLLLAVLLLISCSPAADQGTEVPPSAEEPSPQKPFPPGEDEPVPPLKTVPDFETEVYDGPLYHAFTHFLIAFPDIARTNSYGQNLDSDCVTPTEFRRILEELYRNGFVLMNLNGYVEICEEGTVTRKPIMVPTGKKPLIFSFDDINYYSGNLGKGICDKVVLDGNGKLAMSTMQDERELITYDNCVIPILEAFCEEFPDFSPFGDKGLLSITGYDGILGYRTHRDSPDRESEIAAAKLVVDALLESGWYFASHGYGHYDLAKMTLEHAEEDAQKWIDEVGSIVGDSNIYIFPYGSRTTWNDPRYIALIEKGFPLLMGVGISPTGQPPYIRHTDSYFYMDRWAIEGNTLRQLGERLSPLLNAEYVYCAEERP